MFFSRLFFFPLFSGRIFAYLFWCSVFFLSTFSAFLVVSVAVARYLYVFKVRIQKIL